MGQSNSNTQNIQVLQRALSILDTLLITKTPMGVNELAKYHNYQPSTTFRILKTLEDLKWVYQRDDQKYYLGNKFYLFSEDNLFVTLKDTAYYVMAKHTQQESQAMNLLVRKYEKCFILQQTRTNQMVDYVPPIGTFLPIYASAGGKLLLAYLDNEELLKILDLLDFKRLTGNTIINKKDFLVELQNIREREYSVDFRESTENGCCIAVPVKNHKNEVIAALSFSGILGSREKKELLYFLPYLRTATKEITELLSF
jgi:DNA-binding IclR family transcriptional regulator